MRGAHVVRIASIACAFTSLKRCIAVPWGCAVPLAVGRRITTDSKPTEPTVYSASSITASANTDDCR